MRGLCDGIGGAPFTRQGRQRTDVTRPVDTPCPASMNLPLDCERHARLNVREFPLIVCQNRSPMKGIIMATGTVKWFNSDKGYGFIAPDQGSTDVFVHISAVQRAGLTGLADGQKVSYDIVRDKRSGKDSADNLQTLARKSASWPKAVKSGTGATCWRRLSWPGQCWGSASAPGGRLVRR